MNVCTTSPICRIHVIGHARSLYNLSSFFLKCSIILKIFFGINYIDNEWLSVSNDIIRLAVALSTKYSHQLKIESDPFRRAADNRRDSVQCLLAVPLRRHVKDNNALTFFQQLIPIFLTSLLSITYLLNATEIFLKYTLS